MLFFSSEDILVFLTGQEEIQTAVSMIRDAASYLPAGEDLFLSAIVYYLKLK